METNIQSFHIEYIEYRIYIVPAKKKKRSYSESKRLHRLKLKVTQETPANKAPNLSVFLVLYFLPLAG